MRLLEPATPLAAAALAAVALAATLAGCALIDQRTFERTAAVPSQAQLARSAQRPVGETPPLARIFFGNLDQDWSGEVLEAVRDALVRRPDAEFDIVTSFPTARGEAAEQLAIDTGSADAAAVAGVIEADGVPAERLHLGVRGDAGDPPREVLVLLR